MTAESRSGWIEIDPRKYDEDSLVRGGGLEFHLFTSPYDFPEAIRGEYSKAKRRFVIDLRYIGTEPVEAKSVDEFVTLALGKNSHRVYGIEIDVERMGARSVALRVSDALDALLSRLGPHRAPADNFRITKQVIADNQNRLLGALATAQ